MNVEILFLISISFVLLGLVCELSGATLSKNFKYAIIFFVMLFLIVMTANIIPATNMDLYRYHARIDLYRNGGISYLKEQLSKSVEWISCLFFYLMSKFSFENLTPVIALLICMGIFIYIYHDYNLVLIKEEKHTNPLIICLGLFFAWMPYFQIIDNLRSPIASAICALAVYQQLIKKKPFRKEVFLYIIAALTHTQSVFYLAIIILTFSKNVFYKLRYLFLLGVFAYPILASILVKIPNIYIKYAAGKMLSYSSAGATTNNLFNELTISRIFMIIVFLFIFEGMLNKFEYTIFLKWLRLFCVIVVGCSFYPEIIRRMPFIFGFLAPVEIGYINNQFTKSSKIISNILIWGCIMGMQVWAIMKMTRFSVAGWNYEYYFEMLGLL